MGSCSWVLKIFQLKKIFKTQFMKVLTNNDDTSIGISDYGTILSLIWVTCLPPSYGCRNWTCDGCWSRWHGRWFHHSRQLAFNAWRRWSWRNFTFFLKGWWCRETLRWLLITIDMIVCWTWAQFVDLICTEAIFFYLELMAFCSFH